MNIKTCCGCPSGKEHSFCGCECHKTIGIGKDYELVLASETFDDNNGGYEFGINWLDGEGENTFVVDCEWFKTVEERQEAIDRWYADLNNVEPEQ